MDVLRILKDNFDEFHLIHGQETEYDILGDTKFVVQIDFRVGRLSEHIVCVCRAEERAGPFTRSRAGADVCLITKTPLGLGL